MALRFTGLTISKALKPILFQPCFVVQSSLSQPVRYAARKGYRVIKKRNKKQKPVSTAVMKEEFKIRRKFIKVEKTVEGEKPDPPTDDVIIADNFKVMKYSMMDAVNFHKEYHHPTVFNNPGAGIFTKIEFDMTAKKKTQFLKPFKGIALIPYPFNTKLKREVLVFCHPEHVKMALDCGATIAGGTDLIKKIQQGIVQPNMYEYVLCHIKFLPELNPIRGVLKNQWPKIKLGTLTADLKSAIMRFLHGVEYACVKIGSSNDFAVIDCQLGTIDMKAEHIEANFKSFLEELNQYRPQREGDFITWVWCRSPPSPEEFAIDLKQYVEAEKVVTREEDEDEEEEKEKPRAREKEEIKKILQELEEKGEEEQVAN